MFEFRTDSDSPNYQAAIWYGVGGAMRYLIDMKPNYRPDKPYNTALARERLAFFDACLKTMPAVFQAAVEHETRRLPSPECSEFIEIDAAENFAGIILGGGTLVPTSEHDFEIIGYNEMIDAFSYELIATLSSATVPSVNDTPAQLHHSAQHRRKWQADYRAHIRTVAVLLQSAGVTASNLAEAV